MGDVSVDQAKSEAIARINARLESVLHETRKDEAKLKDILEMKRLKRRLASKYPEGQ